MSVAFVVFPTVETKQAAWSKAPKAIILPDRFVFDGKGYGHRVGMSQWGAQGMALGGATFEQILEHYYTGAELGRVKLVPTPGT